MSNPLSNFEDVVDSAIRRRGFRISSRKPFEYRLKRYIELMNTQGGGEPLTTAEVDAIAGLLVMVDDKAQELIESGEIPVAPTGQVTFMVNANDTHTRTFEESGSHPMVRRSQVSCCARVCESGPVRMVMRASTVSQRSAMGPTRTHPMKLRSRR
jgi:hypothetical protein